MNEGQKGREKSIETSHIKVLELEGTAGTNSREA